MKNTRRLLCVVMAMVTLLTTLATGITTIDAGAASKTYSFGVKVKYHQTDARKMLGYINNFRTSKDAWYWSSDNKTKVKCKNLKKLSYDYTLEKMAMDRVAEIAVHFDLNRPDGREWKTIYSDYKYGMYFYGQSYGANKAKAKGMFNYWRADKKDYSEQIHRRNMLHNEFDSVGVSGVTYNGHTFWVAIYASSKKINKTKTSAINSAKTKNIKMLKKYVEYVEILTVDPIKVKKGKNIAMPKITVNVVATKAWAEYELSVIPSFKFTVGNASIAKVQKNRIYGLKKGETTLKIKTLGSSEIFDLIVK